MWAFIFGILAISSITMASGGLAEETCQRGRKTVTVNLENIHDPRALQEAENYLRKELEKFKDEDDVTIQTIINHDHVITTTSKRPPDTTTTSKIPPDTTTQRSTTTAASTTVPATTKAEITTLIITTQFGGETPSSTTIYSTPAITSAATTITSAATTAPTPAAITTTSAVTKPATGAELNVTEIYSISSCPPYCNSANGASYEDHWCVRVYRCTCNGITLNVKPNTEHLQTTHECLRPVGKDCLNVCDFLHENPDISHHYLYDNITMARISRDSNTTIKVYCDCNNVPKNGVPLTYGWVILQRRRAASNNVNTTFQNYKKTVGEVHGPGIWFGLGRIRALTLQNASLQIELGKKNGEHMEYFYIRYSQFNISDQDHGYAISVIKEPHNDNYTLPDYLDPNTKRSSFTVQNGSGWWFHDDGSGSNLNAVWNDGIRWGNITYDTVMMKMLPGGAEEVHCTNINETFALETCPKKCRSITSSSGEWCRRDACICDYPYIRKDITDACRMTDDCIVPIGNDCKEICERGEQSDVKIQFNYKNKFSPDGLVAAQIFAKGKMLVLCDCFENQIDVIPDTIDWVVIQRRLNTGKDFDQSLENYKAGFSQSAPENFWIGLRKLYNLTKSGASLQIELGKTEGEKMNYRYIRYRGFKISGFDQSFSMSAEFESSSVELEDFMDPKNQMPQFTIAEQSGWWFSGSGTNLNGKTGIQWGNDTYDVVQMKVSPGNATVLEAKDCSGICHDYFNAFKNNTTDDSVQIQTVAFIEINKVYKKVYCECSGDGNSWLVIQSQKNDANFMNFSKVKDFEDVKELLSTDYAGELEITLKRVHDSVEFAVLYRNFRKAKIGHLVASDSDSDTDDILHFSVGNYQVQWCSPSSSTSTSISCNPTKEWGDRVYDEKEILFDVLKMRFFPARVPVAKDCREVCSKRKFAERSVGFTTRGTKAYIQIDDSDSSYTEVFCDCSCNESDIYNTFGWMVIQRSDVNGTFNFTKLTLQYDEGFGQVYGEYWLGFEKIAKLLEKDGGKMQVVFKRNGRHYFNKYRIHPFHEEKLKGLKLTGDTLHENHVNPTYFTIMSSGWWNDANSAGLAEFRVHDYNFTVAEIRILPSVEPDLNNYNIQNDGLTKCPVECDAVGSDSQYCISQHCDCKKASQDCSFYMVPVAKNCREVCNERNFTGQHVGFTTWGTKAYVGVDSESYYEEVFCDCSCNVGIGENTYGWVVILRGFSTWKLTQNYYEGSGQVYDDEFWLGFNKIEKLMKEQGEESMMKAKMQVVFRLNLKYFSLKYSAVEVESNQLVTRETASGQTFTISPNGWNYKPYSHADVSEIRIFPPMKGCYGYNTNIFTLEKFGMKSCPEECDGLVSQYRTDQEYCISPHCSCRCIAEQEDQQDCSSCIVPVANNCIEVCDARNFKHGDVDSLTRGTNAYVRYVKGGYGEVFCDCSCNGSDINNTYGWVVILRIVNKATSFDSKIRSRSRRGFGNLKNGTFWLGLGSIFDLAAEDNILLLVLHGNEQDYYVTYRIWIKSNAIRSERVKAWTNLPQSSPIENYFWIGSNGWWFNNDDHYSYQNANWATKMVLAGAEYTLKEMKLLPTSKGCPRLQDLNSCPVKCNEIKTLNTSPPTYCRNTYCNCTCTGTIAEEWRGCNFCILPVVASCSGLADQMKTEEWIEKHLKLEIESATDDVFPAYFPSKGRIDYCRVNGETVSEFPEIIVENCPAICNKMSDGIINNREAGFSEYGTGAKIHIGNTVFDAYCDCTNNSNDGLPPTYGWVVIQRRVNSYSFHRKYEDYEKGFGDQTGSFMLGLQNIERLAGKNHGAKLQIELKSGTERYFLRHNSFWIEGRSDWYKLRVGDLEQDDSKGYRQHNLNRTKMEDADGKNFLMYDFTGGEGIRWWLPIYLTGDTYTLNGPYDAAAGGVEWFAPNDGLMYYDIIEMKICPDDWDCS